MKKLTREELTGTHIKNDCEEKAKAYLSALRAVGFNLNLPKNPICGIYECHVSRRDGYRVSYVVNKANLDEGSRELHLSDLIELENSKVKTTDQEVVRKFAKLVGAKCLIDHGKYNSEWYCHEGAHVSCLHPGCYDSYSFHEVTVEQINALYKEKMMSKPNQNIRTVYELVTDMTTDEIAKSMISGEVFYDDTGSYMYLWDGEGFVDNHGARAKVTGEYYRKVEKSLTWQEVVEEEYESFKMPRDPMGKLRIGKNWSEADFINFCRDVIDAADKSK